MDKFSFKERRKNLKEFRFLRRGDIIFQVSETMQGKTMQKLTKSKYNHIGIIMIKKNNKGYKHYYSVFDASRRVPYANNLKEWIAKGKNSHYVIKRINDPKYFSYVLLKREIEKYRKEYRPRQYDNYYSWTDEEMYNSEFVWKVYKRALNIELGKTEQLKDFDLSDPEVKKLLHTKYGRNIPFNDTVISPISIFNDENLSTIIER